MQVSVTRDQPDGLKRQVWVFHLSFFGSGDLASLRLTRWAEEERPTKRHKWRPVRQWYEHNALFDRGFCQRIPNPPVPDDVVTAARDLLCDMIQSTPVVTPKKENEP